MITQPSSVNACLDYHLDYQNEHREFYLLTDDLAGCFGGTHDRYELSALANQRTLEWLVDIIKTSQKSMVDWFPYRSISSAGYRAMILGVRALKPRIWR